MKCVISGGTGFIGRRIAEHLRRGGHHVDIWSRRAPAPFTWDPLQGEPSIDSLNAMDAVIHLAGETVAQRWNPEVKRRIADSRILGTRILVDAISRTERKPKVLVSASAIGYYGDRGDEILSERSEPGTGFLAEVCRGWEVEADRAAEFGLRVIKLRIGFVLGKGGGALAQMIPPFRAFVGGRLGSGKQWMPWIHLADVAELFLFAVENNIAGVWNASSPNPVTNAEFTAELGRALHRPAVFPIPPIALKLVFGELGQHMLDSSRVVPDAALKAGYQFRYTELSEALKNLVPAYT
jgi:uncharacterized protein